MLCLCILGWVLVFKALNKFLNISCSSEVELCKVGWWGGTGRFLRLRQSRLKTWQGFKDQVQLQTGWIFFLLLLCLACVCVCVCEWGGGATWRYLSPFSLFLLSLPKCSFHTRPIAVAVAVSITPLTSVLFSPVQKQINVLSTAVQGGADLGQHPRAAFAPATFILIFCTSHIKSGGGWGENGGHSAPPPPPISPLHRIRSHCLPESIVLVIRTNGRGGWSKNV